MFVFEYVGVQNGKKITGQIQSESLTQARMNLRKKRIRITKIKKKKSHNRLNSHMSWGPFGTIPSKEILMFTKKLATMVRAGLPIMNSFVMISEQTKNKNVKHMIACIVDRLNAGQSLSEAFRPEKRYFDHVYLNMIEAGEVTGQLDKFMTKLVEIMEKQEKIKSGIKSAMFYPITLVVVTLSITFFMLRKVVPTFQDMYAGMGMELPAATQAIVTASQWILNSGNVLRVIGIVMLIYMTHKLMLRYIKIYLFVWCHFILKTPLFGDILMKATVARVSLLMANLLPAGISVLDTIDVVKRVTQNVIFLNAFNRVQVKVASGIELSVLFSREKVFPLTFSQFIAIGESTGHMDEMLDAVAQYYEEEFDTIIARLSTIIEPIMIVLVGAMIGAMVIALYLPIFSAGNLAGG